MTLAELLFDLESIMHTDDHPEVADFTVTVWDALDEVSSVEVDFENRKIILH